jgi:hypothetical protein
MILLEAVYHRKSQGYGPFLIFEGPVMAKSPVLNWSSFHVWSQKRSTPSERVCDNGQSCLERMRAQVQQTNAWGIYPRRSELWSCGDFRGCLGRLSCLEIEVVVAEAVASSPFADQIHRKNMNPTSAELH